MSAAVTLALHTEHSSVCGYATRRLHTPYFAQLGMFTQGDFAFGRRHSSEKPWRNVGTDLDPAGHATAEHGLGVGRGNMIMAIHRGEDSAVLSLGGQHYESKTE